MDSAIDMPTSSIPFPEADSNGFPSSHGTIPGSSPSGFQESAVSFDQGFMADPAIPSRSLTEPMG
jgi:hypothetical protein